MKAYICAVVDFELQSFEVELPDGTTPQELMRCDNDGLVALLAAQLKVPAGDEEKLASAIVGAGGTVANISVFNVEIDKDQGDA